MLWLEINLATSVCFLSLFSPLTFQVRMLFIVIDGVSPQHFNWKFLCTSFLPKYIHWFSHKGIKGVRCCDLVVLTFSTTPHSKGGSVGTWTDWYRSPILFPGSRLLLYCIMFSNHQLVSIFVFSRLLSFLGAFWFPLSPLHSCSLWLFFLHLLQRIGFHS